MRARTLVIFSIASLSFLFDAPVYADELVTTCDVLDTSTASTTTDYPSAYCGNATGLGKSVSLSATSTLNAFEVNIALNIGGIQYFKIQEGAGMNFVGSTTNRAYLAYDFGGIGTGLHTFVLPYPITFGPGSAPSFILCSDPLCNVASTAKLYGSDASNGQQPVFYQKWFWDPPPEACIALGTCASNILFLPGIEGSRLYEGTGCGKGSEEKLWEPYDSFLKALRGAGDTKTRNLFLDQTGASICSDIYTKEGDIIDSVGGSNLYASFITQMNGMKTDGTIKDWKSVAYDWRLSLTDLLAKGTLRNGNIYYEEATSTPYIEQTLRALAGTSKTGKVTVVAHSNGGLVTKALLNKLGSEASTLVDKIVLVGVPQSGAPEALGITLVGHNAGIYTKGVPIVSNVVARELAQNSPMAYHLLPSQSYFDSVMDDHAHPVARFTGDAYAKESSVYGNAIGNLTELDDFLLAKEKGREKPKASDLSSLEILNSPLVDYANTTHNTLDAWIPPSGIEASQIAGWGVDTVAGIDFYTLPAVSALTALGPVRAYRPLVTEDGDGTVPVPSALMMASSTEVKRYWVDLANSSIKHSNFFENSDLRTFLKNIVTNNSESIPPNISMIAPLTTGAKKLTFYLHSPLTLELTDSSGNVTGLAEDGTTAEGIPNSTYDEFGEVKYITVPEGGSYTLAMHGQDTGTFSLDIQESSGGVVTASSTIANVPTTRSTLASLTISGGIETASALRVDENGDGGNIISITPRVGETVSYEPPAPTPVHAPAPPVSAGSISIPVITPLQTFFTPVIESVSVPSIATDTPEMATTTETQFEEKTEAPVISTVTPEVDVSKDMNTNIPQTAAVYEAAKQSLLNKLGEAVYTGLQWIWSVLMRFF